MTNNKINLNDDYLAIHNVDSPYWIKEGYETQWCLDADVSGGPYKDERRVVTLFYEDEDHAEEAWTQMRKFIKDNQEPFLVPISNGVSYDDLIN